VDDPVAECSNQKEIFKVVSCERPRRTVEAFNQTLSPGREIEVDIRKMTPRSHRSFPVEGQALGEAKKFGLIDSY